jgi:hypothetical protein
MAQEKYVKVCRKHGWLTAEQCIKAGNEGSGSPRYNCKICFKVRRDRHYAKNREAVLAKHAKLREEKPELVKAWKRKWYEANRDYINQYHRELRVKWKAAGTHKDRDRSAKYKRKACDTLNDYYVKKSLTSKSILYAKDIPQSLVEMHRITMLLRRTIKRKKKEKNLG